MDFTGIIKTVAPWLGTAIAGPLGGMAVGAIADALGASAQTTDGIKAALSGATPDQMLNLKNADVAFAVKMKELGYADIEKMAQLSNDDRASARQREMTIKDVTPMVLAFVVTFGFFGVLAALMFLSVPGGSRDVLNIMLGSLGTAWTGVVAYYFGSSSSGSDRKTELLAGVPK
ncbi:MAG: hypothetical protein H7335_09890 [Massilia sp.]|nr:hypothetical protein [Massilia sp.]